MRGISTLPLLALMVAAGACGSCGGTQIPTSDRAAIPVTITITNDRAETIYLTSQDSCEVGLVTIGDLGLYGGQSLSCDEAKTGPCPDFGGCAQPGVRPLATGESWETTWDGYAYQTVNLEPSETGENCPTVCVVWLPAEAGSYPVSAQARSSCAGERCDWELESEGSSCYPDEPFDGPPDLKAEAQLTLPESATAPVALELHFR